MKDGLLGGSVAQDDLLEMCCGPTFCVPQTMPVPGARDGCESVVSDSADSAFCENCTVKVVRLFLQPSGTEVGLGTSRRNNFVGFKF